MLSEALAARRRTLVTGAAILIAYVLAAGYLPHGLPSGIVLLGVTIGLINALGAIGLILVYRAGKYINFAHGGIGAAGAVLTFQLINYYRWNWYVSVAVGLLVAVSLAVLAEVFFIQRLFKSPRLILTVATIGIAQFVAFFEFGFKLLKGSNVTFTSIKTDPPLKASFHLTGVKFSGGHILVLIVVPLILLGFTVFFRRSRYGSVVQAAAENSDRARLLGVSVRSISTMTWLVIGLLSGLTAILAAPVTGLNVGGASGPGLLLRALAPAMIARLERLPTAVVAAILLGIGEQALAFNLRSSGPIDLLLFLVILLVLVTRRGAGGRTTEAEERSFAVSTTVRVFPRELARELPLRIARIGWLVAMLLLVLVVPAQMRLSTQQLATALVAIAIGCLSITVLTGMAGQVSLGQWAVVGAGALFGGALASQHDLPFELGLFFIPLAGALLSLFMGLSALRIRGIFFGVTTLGFAVAAHSYLFQRSWFHVDGFVDRPAWLEGQLAYFYFSLAMLLLCMLMVGNVRRSSIGRAMVAVRDNDRAAASYGIGQVGAKLAAFALSGFLASLAGYLYLYNDTRPGAGNFAPLTSLLLFSAVVIGGLGSQTGAILGAIYFRGVQYFFPDYMQFLATSLGLLMILLFLPGGIGSLFFGARDALLRRYAKARGIRVPSLVADTREVDDDDGPDEHSNRQLTLAQGDAS